jgi:hypothetical protein
LVTSRVNGSGFNDFVNPGSRGKKINEKIYFSLDFFNLITKRSLLWIRVGIKSGFEDFVDPD